VVDKFNPDFTVCQWMGYYVHLFKWYAEACIQLVMEYLKMNTRTQYVNRQIFFPNLVVLFKLNNELATRLYIAHIPILPMLDVTLHV